MAELMLLLLFCLLLVAAGALQQKEDIIQKLEIASSTDPATSLPDTTIAERLRETTEQLDRITANAPPEFKNPATPIDEKTWKELELGRDFAKRAEEAGLSLEEMPTQATLAQLDALKSIASTEGMSVEQLVAEVNKTRSEISGHDWPPIITLGSDEFRFKVNSAELSESFRDRLQTRVAEQVRTLLAQYDVDVVEVVGHTDEQPIYSTKDSTMYAESIGALAGRLPVSSLKPVDNVGLGFARAIAVANALGQAGLPAGVRVIPLSAAQVVKPGDVLSDGLNPSDSADRRRIEIRIRRSTESIQ
jgi:outer membrane protein OmpA-like peptidoglycan-associated protein